MSFTDKVLYLTASLTALNGLMAAIPDTYVQANDFVSFVRGIIQRKPIGLRSQVPTTTVVQGAQITEIKGE